MAISKCLWRRGELCRTGPLMAGSILSVTRIPIPGISREFTTCGATEPRCIATPAFVAGSAASIATFSRIPALCPGSSTWEPATSPRLAVGPSIAASGLWQMGRNQRNVSYFRGASSWTRYSASESLTPSVGTMEEIMSSRSVTQRSKNFSRASAPSFSVFSLSISSSDNHRISKSTNQGRHALDTAKQSRYETDVQQIPPEPGRRVMTTAQYPRAGRAYVSPRKGI